MKRPPWPDLAIYLLSAAFALVTAFTSTLLPHRAWGFVAWPGYLLAALLAFVAARALVAAFAWAAVALLPLTVQAVQRAGGRTDRAQEEVVVVEHAGARLLETGTPYLDRAAIAALPEGERLLGYTPYQPGMAVFGLPRAIFGATWVTDARVWFALVTLLAVVGAALLLKDHDLVRAGQLALVLPLSALTLATGGDDLPVLALSLLALALVARERWGWAGVAIGAAGALKLFAWPVALVLAVLACSRAAGLPYWRPEASRAALLARPDANRAAPLAHPEASRAAPLAHPDANRAALLARPDASRAALLARPGRRFGSFAAGAFGLPALVLAPAFLVDADAAVENVVRFPLGHGQVTSPAQSPLVGYLVAQWVPGGRTVATVLLLVAGLAVAAWMWRRPPATAADAALVCAVGLTAAILLMPSTRFGYFLYPVAYLGMITALRPPPGVAGSHDAQFARTQGA